MGNVTAYAYDARDRLITVTEADPDGGGSLTSPVTAFAYDDANQLITVTDALARVTTYAYDNLGRLKTTTLPDPDGGGSLTSPVYTTSYDAVGNVLTTTDPLGNVTTYAYDNLNRLLTLTEADPDGGGGLYKPEFPLFLLPGAELFQGDGEPEQVHGEAPEWFARLERPDLARRILRSPLPRRAGDRGHVGLHRAQPSPLTACSRCRGLAVFVGTSQPGGLPGPRLVQSDAIGAAVRKMVDSSGSRVAASGRRLETPPTVIGRCLPQ